MGQTIPNATEQEIQLALSGIKIQAEFFLNKTVFSQEEEKFLRHMAEIVANKNKWIDFYQNILHEELKASK